jgi:predicted dehydrogenase
MSQKEEKIKFAVVGAGHIGKRHAEMIRRDEESELVAMVDVRSMEECDATHFEVPFFSSIDELLASGIDFDVANICTPNGLHAAQSLAALEAKKHVVCEKPMGLSKDNCEKVIFKSLQMSKHVFCVMQNRYSPPSEWIKSIIDEKKMGDIFMVQLNCYWNRDDRYYKKGGWKGTADLDGGTLFTQFSHFIDIMYWLFGDIDNISGKFADFTHKDSNSSIITVSKFFVLILCNESI